MKALFVPAMEGYSIELIAEDEEDRRALVRHYYYNDMFAVTCEEWRSCWILDKSKGERT